ncbi:MAG: CocE/NonD family hydrolase [Rhodospirillaceae bacterium]|nr:CocE/NonD family hydrolase [Rhodospirillaceae bacterium]
MNVVGQFPRRVREIENEWITLKDGTRLAARIWLPEDAAKNPVPAILEYLPYRKRDGTSERDELTHPYFAGHGYACVRVDMRGSGESDGLLLDEYIKQEQDDALEVIDWLEKQPWCTGNVGMIGISWGGFNGLQIAARRPKQLKAVISLCSTDDRYADDIHFMGGALLNDNLGWGSVMFGYMSRTPDKALLGDKWRDIWMHRLENHPLLAADWLEHQRRDALWKHGSICEDWSAIEAAVYLVGGWADGYSNTIPRMLQHLQCPKKGLVGPWAHKYPHFAKPGPRIGFLKECLRFWDQWLKGKDTGIMDEPEYRAWILDYEPPHAFYEQRKGRWVAEPSWPSPNIVPLTLALNSDGLAAKAGKETAISYLSPQDNGAGSGAWCGYGLGPQGQPDQRMDDGKSLCFDSAPLDAPLEILGAPIVKLDVAIDRKQGFVVARICDVAPDGSSQRVSYGVLNLSHRNSHEKPEAMKPGERTKIRVQLCDIGWAFPKGHRIRLALSTSYWPILWPSPEPVTLTVHAGASKLVLPSRKPRAEDRNLPAFEEAESAPPQKRTHLTPGSSRRWFEHDIGSEMTRYHIEERSGRFIIDSHGLESESDTIEIFSVKADDPLSAEVDISVSYSIGRGDWQTRTETRTVMTCTKTDYIFDATLDAYEGVGADERRVYSKNYHRVIKRDFN